MQPSLTRSSKSSASCRPEAGKVEVKVRERKAQTKHNLTSRISIFLFIFNAVTKRRRAVTSSRKAGLASYSANYALETGVGEKGKKLKKVNS